MAQLARIGREGGGARAFVNVKVSTNQRRDTFPARIAFDSTGRLRVDVLTPFGTAAYSIFADGHEATLVDRLHSTYWKGQSRALGALVPLFAARIESGEIARLLAGLPAGDEKDTRYHYETGAQGLAKVIVRESDTSLIIRYVPASFPPEKILVESGEGELPFELEIRYLELTRWSGRLTEPDLRGLRCCFLPGS